MAETKAAPIKLAVAVVALIVAAAIVVTQMGGPSNAPPEQAYYYDLGSGEIFKAAAGDLPVEAPSGSTGVRAHVVSCGACEPGEWQVLTIQSYTDEAQQVLSKPQPDVDQPAALEAWNRTVDEGKLIAVPPEAGAEPQWVSHEQYLDPQYTAPEAVAIRERSSDVCGGGPITPCAP